MATNNTRYLNAAIAGIGGASKSAWVNDPVVGDYAAYSNAVAAAAAAVDAALPAVSGGATTAGANLLQSVCYAVFAQRNVSSTTQSDYATVAASIAALFTSLLAKTVAAPGSQAKVLGIVVPAITAPNTAQVSVTDATFIGANTIGAEFSGAPSNTQLGIQGQWITNTATGAFVASFVKVVNNYAGATEQVRVQANS